MPELPEVETVRRGLAPTMVGARFAKVETRRGDLRAPFPPRFAERLKGRRVLSLTRRAKYLLAALDSGETLVMHLGMSGSFRVERGDAARRAAVPPRAAEARRPRPCRLRLSITARASSSTIRAASARWIWSRAKGSTSGRRSPRSASSRCRRNSTPRRLAALFAGARAPIKTALLDQKRIAGLGNIYVCEALHRARIKPTRPASTARRRQGQADRRRARAGAGDPRGARGRRSKPAARRCATTASPTASSAISSIRSPSTTARAPPARAAAAAGRSRASSRAGGRRSIARRARMRDATTDIKRPTCARGACRRLRRNRSLNAWQRLCARRIRTQGRPKAAAGGGALSRILDFEFLSRSAPPSNQSASPFVSANRQQRRRRPTCASQNGSGDYTMTNRHPLLARQLRGRHRRRVGHRPGGGEALRGDGAQRRHRRSAGRTTRQSGARSRRRFAERREGRARRADRRQQARRGRGAREGRDFGLRPGRRADEQRRDRAGQFDPRRRLAGVAARRRRQPVGRHPRQQGVRAGHDRQRAAGDDRQHRLEAGHHDAAGRPRLQPVEGGREGVHRSAAARAAQHRRMQGDRPPADPGLRLHAFDGARASAKARRRLDARADGRIHDGAS